MHVRLARKNRLSLSVVFEMIAYDFYRIVPPGVGLIGVTCMIDGWQADAYRTGLARIEECATELGRRKCDFIIHAGVPLVVSQTRVMSARL